MTIFKCTISKWISMLPIAAIVLYAMAAAAQNPTDSCKPTHVIPQTGSEPPVKVIIDPRLPGPSVSSLNPRNEVSQSAESSKPETGFMENTDPLPSKPAALSDFAERFLAWVDTPGWKK